MANQPIDVFKYIDMHNGDSVPCWEWLQSVNNSTGRPYFTVQRKKWQAYALVYSLVYLSDDSNVPVFIPKGQVIRHICDNKVCCNPHHLELGTHQENMDDMKKRERHGLPHNTVKAIRKSVENGQTHKQVADLFGISPENVSAIITGRSYKHVMD